MAVEVLIFVNFWGLGEYCGKAALDPDVVLTTVFRGSLSGSVRRLWLIAERGKRCA